MSNSGETPTELSGAPTEESYDPADWAEFRRLAHRMVDDMLECLETLPERPVWRETPVATRDRLREPLPVAAQGVQQAYDDFVRDVLPFPNGNLHPRYWGWVQGTGTPLGMIYDGTCALVNSKQANQNYNGQDNQHDRQRIAAGCFGDLIADQRSF